MNSGFGLRAASGMVGAGVLTAIHQAAQRVRSDAPRMDIIGMQTMARGIAAAGRPVPAEPQLFRMTLAGDLIANAIYYSGIPAATSRQTWGRAVVSGVTAGVGALTLPRYVAGEDPPHSDRFANNVMTIAWYLAGALAAAAFAEAWRMRRRR